MGPGLILLAGAALAEDPAVATETPAQEAEDPVVLGEVRALQARIEALRGLRFEADVEVRSQTEDELRASILATLDAELTPDVARGMTLALRAFGLVPDGFDARSAFGDLLTEQVAGYYTPRSRALFVIARGEDDDVTGPLAEVLVTEHELVHALQDQHFDLWGLTERRYHDDDVSVAVRALVEGDATWVMLADTVSAFGIDPDEADLGSLMQKLSLGADVDNPVLSSTPPVLTRGLIVPYSDGPLLVDRLRDIDGWRAVNAAFSAPPLSTEQVLHPERYLADAPDWPTRLNLPELSLAGCEPVYTNTMGEMQIRVLFEQYAPDVAIKAGDGWDGDRYTVCARGDTPALVWLSTWDTARDAEEFATAAARFAAERYPSSRWRVDTTGQDVLVVTGLKPKVAAEAARQVAAGTTRVELRVPDDVAPYPGPRPN